MLIWLIWPGLITAAEGQDVFKAAQGKVRFYSDAPLGDIDATTMTATAALDVFSGTVTVKMTMKGFVFEKSLMQEHFNEKYMESDKFPVATFNGKIPERIRLAPGERKLYTMSGDLLIHGVSQPRDIKVLIGMNSDQSLTASGKFDVKMEDHKVKIPTLLFRSVTEMVEVTFELNLKSAL